VYVDLAFLGRRGEYVIEPVVRDVVIEGYIEKLTPILRREPLYTAANKYVRFLSRRRSLGGFAQRFAAFPLHNVRGV
jgi:hypothetical protein